MPDDNTPAEPDTDPIAELRARAEALERRLAESEQESAVASVRAELKVEAVRAGMVDLDGLKLLDLRDVQLNAQGELDECRRSSWRSSGARSPGCSGARHRPAQRMPRRRSRRGRSLLPK